MKIGDRGTLDIFLGRTSAEARRALPTELHEKAARLLDRLKAAGAPSDLRTPRGNRLEKLLGDRTEQYSIRINDRYRICFVWENHEAIEIVITDYH
ncbi:MAG: plasmid maintenance system killer protein [Candidatus Eremiobacteraeota bacterium]|uniref:Plasmid maintenance system killer n=1 Tax=mine drainage metagenome TaxID=410659 RepID=E6Q207_9ZZZZ|nr:type II toxin-antitoxin system RelE/ParE family toxin [Candidatus Eremiobacteraeota bacterium]NNM92373.1 plasmid maintenance system killer protein [Candidatus Eremiobacteraeota bacterium]